MIESTNQIVLKYCKTTYNNMKMIYKEEDFIPTNTIIVDGKRTLAFDVRKYEAKKYKLTCTKEEMGSWTFPYVSQYWNWHVAMHYDGRATWNGKPDEECDVSKWRNASGGHPQYDLRYPFNPTLYNNPDVDVLSPKCTSKVVKSISLVYPTDPKFTFWVQVSHIQIEIVEDYRHKYFNVCNLPWFELEQVNNSNGTTTWTIHFTEHSKKDINGNIMKNDKGNDIMIPSNVVHNGYPVRLETSTWVDMDYRKGISNPDDPKYAEYLEEFRSLKIWRHYFKEEGPKVELDLRGRNAKTWPLLELYCEVIEDIPFEQSYPALNEDGKLVFVPISRKSHLSIGHIDSERDDKHWRSIKNISRKFKDLEGNEIVVPDNKAGYLQDVLLCLRISRGWNWQAGFIIHDDNIVAKDITKIVVSLKRNRKIWSHNVIFCKHVTQKNVILINGAAFCRPCDEYENDADYRSKCKVFSFSETMLLTQDLTKLIPEEHMYGQDLIRKTVLGTKTIGQTHTTSGTGFYNFGGDPHTNIKNMTFPYDVTFYTKGNIEVNKESIEIYVSTFDYICYTRQIPALNVPMYTMYTPYHARDRVLQLIYTLFANPDWKDRAGEIVNALECDGDEIISSD